MTYTVSPTNTPTPVPMPYRIRITFYNSAGEKVRLLYDGAAEVKPGTVPLDVE